MDRVVYIIGAARTPVGSFMGRLSTVSAVDLGGLSIQAALSQSQLKSDQIDEGYMGCVLQAGLGQAPARQAMADAGIPDTAGATTINKVCGSGLKAVMLARTEILAGEADVIVAGGMESMSQVPYYAKSLRTGNKLGHQQLLDGMILDGLWDPYNDVHMGNCAERCAEKYGFTREDQDAYAKESYVRAQKAQEAGWFQEEIVAVPVPQRKGEPLLVTQDEGIGKAALDKMGGLKPAFEKTGTVTAANASTLNDGAAALIIASEQAVTENNLQPMAKILATTTHSQEPLWFTTAPVGAIRKLLDKAGLDIDDIDLYEISEAFAVVPMAAIKELGLDHAKVNTRGGGISIGHPIGASGARLLVSLVYALRQTRKRYGVACLCIGGGEASAILVENTAL